MNGEAGSSKDSPPVVVMVMILSSGEWVLYGSKKNHSLPMNTNLEFVNSFDRLISFIIGYFGINGSGESRLP